MNNTLETAIAQEKKKKNQNSNFSSRRITKFQSLQINSLWGKPIFHDVMCYLVIRNDDNWTTYNTYNTCINIRIIQASVRRIRSGKNRAEEKEGDESRAEGRREGRGGGGRGIPRVFPNTTVVNLPVVVWALFRGLSLVHHSVTVYFRGWAIA